MTREQLAEVCHEANRVYCQIIGDYSQRGWEFAPDWQRESAIAGVENALNGASPAESHANWLAHKQAEGWLWGPVKDPDRKLHPCMVPYDDLPHEQKRKDALFVAIVRALSE